MFYSAVTCLICAIKLADDSIDTVGRRPHGIPSAAPGTVPQTLVASHHLEVARKPEVAKLKGDL